MNTYTFILENYHSIKNAEIILDGLTVLAGLNGCGKSTISRWLYGFVRFSNEYEQIVDKETAATVYQHNVRLFEIQRQVAFWTKDNSLPLLPRIIGNLESEITSMQERVRDICNSIKKHVSDSLLEKYGRQLWDALGVNDAGVDVQENLDRFVRSEQEYLAGIMEEAGNRKRECSISDLYRIIESNLDIKSKGPMDMQLTENGTDLLDHDFEYIVTDDGARLCDNDGRFIVTDRILGRFIAPLGLKRAIYIDSPMSVSNYAMTSNNIWLSLREMLTSPLRPVQEQTYDIIREICIVLGGDIVVKDDGFGQKELRYVRKSDGLDISVDEVATGMKTFAYILRLLQNGYIDSSTLLIIDEPEAHLHPQWIVKFAKVLVLIRKLLGAKVMVASHDPDMVAAINTMAEAEGLSEVTNFYQAVRNPEETRYAYINSGNDISSIFECFNVALDRIDGYRSIDDNPHEKA